MAAQEYYNPGGVAQGPPPGLSVPQPPPGAQPPLQQGFRPNAGPPSPSNLPYPISDAPPPYQAYSQQQRPQSQPPPQQRIQQTGQAQYQAYNPNPPPNSNSHQYPPEKLQQARPSTLQNMSRPSDYAATHPPPPPLQYAQQPPPPNGYFAPAGPGLGSLSQVTGEQQRPPRRSSMTGYPTTQGPAQVSRSRSREREHRRRHDNRPQSSRKKDSGVNTFLGAGGGAIIGDLIFPGLGTLGGALLGGVGGHEYGKKRTQSNPSSGYRRSKSNYGEYYEDEYRRGRK